MLKVMLLFHILTANAEAHPVGFSRGSEFVATSLQGQVRVVCEGFNGSSSANYTCRDIVLEPSPYDYIIGPRDNRVDQLELDVIREDGSMRSKSMNYDGVFGKTREAANLWISTIFQKPLLSFGVNSIRYKIASQNSNVHYEGNFNVVVKRGPSRQCPSAQYDSMDNNDCNSQYSICQRYFEENRNCK